MQNKGQMKDEDLKLWKAAAKDIKPLAKSSGRGRKKLPLPEEENLQVRERVTLGVTEKKIKKGTGLDKRTDEKLRRGKMEIEARLDLHGMRLAEAEKELKKFITRCWRAEKRCLLIITGKGLHKSAPEEDWWESKPGAIKSAVPGWLKNEALAGKILQTQQAAREHGGSGALYVLLRRKMAK
jgi:DNA-nicking Smr family endonuclease